MTLRRWPLWSIIAICLIVLPSNPQGCWSASRHLSARSKNPLASLARVVDAKLKRTPEVYASSLVDLEPSRVFFQSNQLVSVDQTAALAWTLLGATRTKRLQGWEALERAITRKSRPLEELARMTARLESTLAASYAKARRQGVLSAQGLDVLGPALLWNLKLNKKGFQQDDKASAQQAFWVNTVAKAFPGVAAEDRALRDSLTARALWSFLQLAWLSDPKDVKKRIISRMNDLEQLVGEIPPPDGDFLRLVLNEHRLSQLEKPPSVKTVLGARLATIERLQREMSFLCNPRIYGIAADALLQTIGAAQSQKMTLPDLAKTWEKCLLGADEFLAGNTANPTLIAYQPPLGPSPEIRQAFSHIRIANLSSIKSLSDEDSWGLYFSFTRIVRDLPHISDTEFEAMCGKTSRIPKSVCAHMDWYLRRTDPVVALESLSSIYDMNDVRRLGFIYLCDLATQRIRLEGIPPPGSTARWFKHSFYTKLMRYVDKNHHNFPALEWYVINRNTINSR